MAVLLLPVVLKLSADCPVPVLLLPVVLWRSADSPPAVFWMLVVNNVIAVMHLSNLDVMSCLLCFFPYRAG
jgi:hypothetical protein